MTLLYRDLENGDETLIGQETGDHGNEWKEFNVVLPVLNRLTGVVVRATVNGMFSGEQY